jgi:outer membrane lipoprotein-sorting protein
LHERELKRMGVGARAIGACLCGLLWAGGASVAKGGANEPDLIELLHLAQKNYETVQDYTATFHKQQRVGGVLYGEEDILFKFKKPFMVYMKWIGDIDKGREALYAEGKHDRKLLVHLGGMINYFAPTFALHPTGALAMRRNSRPITESGLGNTITLLVQMCERAQRNGDLRVRYLGAREVGGRPVHLFERTLPRKEGYPAHRTVLALDRETGYPLSVTSYGWSGELLEKYLYEGLRTDVGLTEADFESSNSAYHFAYVTVPIP